MMECIPKILRESGRLLAMGQLSKNIETQVNSDPKAVNLTISLNEEFHFKIVRNIKDALEGTVVYIPDTKEFEWTTKILQENK